MNSPIIRYHGAKWRIAPWVISHLPKHNCYLEPFSGSAAVLLRKDRSQIEVINDLNGRLVNLFRVIRQSPDQLADLIALTPYAEAEYHAAREVSADPIEDARRMMILGWQGHGSTASSGGRLTGWRRGLRHRGPHSADQWSRVPERMQDFAERLAGVFIEQRPAIELIERWGKEPGSLIYADPPYVAGTRCPGEGSRGYAHEMSDADHVALADALKASPATAVISGYRCDLYDELYQDWIRHDHAARVDQGGLRTESLWIKPTLAPKTETQGN